MATDVRVLSEGEMAIGVPHIQYQKSTQQTTTTSKLGLIPAHERSALSVIIRNAPFFIEFTNDYSSVLSVCNYAPQITTFKIIMSCTQTWKLF